jgi:hypothetical protein|tara:strand:+ start:743 stop:952 length:210 start_codon:yes stop_codon:yes gene_type:complete
MKNTLKRAIKKFYKRRDYFHDDYPEDVLVIELDVKNVHIGTVLRKMKRLRQLGEKIFGRFDRIDIRYAA